MLARDIKQISNADTDVKKVMNGGRVVWENEGFSFSVHDLPYDIVTEHTPSYWRSKYHFSSILPDNIFAKFREWGKTEISFSGDDKYLYTKMNESMVFRIYNSITNEASFTKYPRINNAFIYEYEAIPNMACSFGTFAESRADLMKSELTIYFKKSKE